MASRFSIELNKRILIFDGSMGATIQSMDLSIEGDYLGRENCVDILVRSRPEVIQSLHESFLETGCDVVETDTFGASRHVLGEFDDELSSWTFDLNKEAGEIARAACDRFSTADQPRFAAGSIGPGTKLITLNQISWDDMSASYTEQARGLIAGGVDLFIIETCQDLLQVKCAVNACLDALESAGKSTDDIPIMVSITIETTGTMLAGSHISAAVCALRPYPIFSLGLNCATGPAKMAESVAYLSKNWDRAISVIPNAGIPTLIDGQTVFPLQADEFAEALAKFTAEYGVNIVGGCCGTTVEHIGRLVEAVGSNAPITRAIAPPAPGCASLYNSTEYRQELSFLIVGERMNASGSRKFKRLLEEENWDEIISIAKAQMQQGASVLDLNVDYAGRDNARDMTEIVKRVVRQVDGPLMLDSTQIKTIEAGLKCAPGKCIINSANFENGNERFDRFCELAKTFGSALVIGTIDEDAEQAMARTADRKFAIARRAIERATTIHGLDVTDIFIDPLVLPISTGMDQDRRSALELIEGVRSISRAWPDCQIICGLSNVSFGLKPSSRAVLNSVFLHELLEAGLTSAIVHASKILPLNRISDELKQAAFNLIYDRRDISAGGTGLPEGVTDPAFDPLQAFIDLFTDNSAVATNDNEKAVRFSIENELRRHIIEGDKQDLTDHLEVAREKYSPIDIINEHLLEGMKVVGELFGSGQMQLPFVLQSAEVMKMAVRYLEPYMEKVDSQSRGSIVLATVRGDVHDIGKNLVDIILSNNGYTVHNLGIKRPIAEIMDELERTNADAVGMSGLLVKSVTVMEENLHELNKYGVTKPVLLGGAALSRKYAEGYLREIYQGPLYYGKDAFEGLHIMDAVAGGEATTIDEAIETRRRTRHWGSAGKKKVDQAESVVSTNGTSTTAVITPQRSEVTRLIDVPSAPFFGVRVVDDLDLDCIYGFINRNALYRGQWGFKKGSKSKEEYEEIIKNTADSTFDRIAAQMRDQHILEPRLVYGYFPCVSENNDLIIYDPQDSEREVERWHFPRQGDRKHLCIADFFRSAEEVSGGQRDVVGLFLCTMGKKVSEYAHTLFENDEYSEYLFVHGMGVECAEALAEHWHQRMRQELGIADDDAAEIRKLFQQSYRGSRYSFGYPACPDMSKQEIVFRLLKPERIGCILTENWQIDPEQSVSAVVVHHPEARYFNV